MKTLRGFTLIELLVVIAIIAILAAILFPVFLSAKEKANTMKCLAHGKQLGTASTMYMNDNNDRFASDLGAWPEPSKTDMINYLKSITWTYTWDPSVPNQVWNASQQASWRYIQFKQYVKNEDVWICPAPNAMYAKRYAYGFRMSWFPRAIDNFVNGDRGFHNPSGVGLTVTEVQALDRKGETACGSRYLPPSQKIMWMCYAIGRWGNTNIGNPPGTFPWVFPGYAHANGSVFVYADGHAAFQKMGQGWAPLGYTNLPIDKTP